MMTKTYYGTKKLKATPMSRLEYIEYRGWKLPNDENGTDTGYLVEYLDGGAATHPDHEGYISWSPQNVFDTAYQPTDAMNFGHAIQAMKEGHKVARSGWNGKGMSVSYVGWNDTITEDFLYPFMTISNPNDKRLSTWVPSNNDLLAEDWMVI